MIPTATVSQLDEENPWPGLESFREDAQAFFFGRDREVQVLLHQVLDAPVTVLYGRSGLGKTSLLRAGLFPLLRDRDYLPVYVRFDLSQNPGSLSRQLHQAVCASILADVPDAMLPADDESLWEYLHRNDFELWSERNYPLTPVLVLDQFEELFTLGARVPDLIEAFRNEFGDLAENRIPGDLAARSDGDAALADRYDLRSRNYKLLISLREDFLPDLQEWCGLIPTLGRSRVRLRPLSADEAFDAVYKPASHLMTEQLARQVVGIIAGEGLHSERDGESLDTDRDLVDAGGTADVEPPLLSLVCRELNEVRKQRGLSQFDEQLIDEAGHETLSNYYSSCVSGMRPEVARFIETELISENGEYRENFIRDEAVPARLTEDELAQLISSRLVRLDDQYGVRRIELTHDVLTRAVREHRDRRLAEEQQAAVAAEEARREAELEHERNRRRESERVARRFRWLSVALALVCVAALVLSVVTVNMRNDANARFRDATAERLYTDSQLMLAGQSLLGSDDSTAMRMMLASYAIQSTHSAMRYGLLTMLNQERDLIKVIDTPKKIYNVVFSPDGTRIAFGSGDKTVRLWDVGTGRQVGESLRGHDDVVFSVAFSPDGTRIASGSADKTVRLWDLGTGRQVGEPLRGHSDTVNSVAFSPDGNLIASGSADKTVRLWDVGTGRQVGEPLRGHTQTVNSVAFSPDGNLIASGSADKTVRLWDVGTGRQVGEPLRGHTEIVNSVAFSPEGNRIASGGADKTVRLWDVATGQPIGQPLTEDNYVYSVAFSPDGARIVAGGAGKTIRLLDATTMHDVGVLPGHEAAVSSVAYSRDSQRLVSASFDGTVRVWDARSWQPMLGHDDRVVAWFSGDGSRIYSGSQDGSARRWDSATQRAEGEPLRVPGNVGGGLYPFGDDRLISIVEFRGATDVQMWDARTRKPIGESIHFTDRSQVQWTDKGDRIAGETELGVLRAFDGHNMRPIGEPVKPEKGFEIASISLDGKYVATGADDGTVEVWDFGTGKSVGKSIKADTLPITIAISRDRRRLAVSYMDYTLRLWDIDSGEGVGYYMYLDSFGYSLDFSPDDQLVASGSDDGTIRLWDTRDQSQLGIAIRGHTQSVDSVDFSPDGTKLVSASEDKTLRLWPVPNPSPDAARDALCAKLTHNMSPDQWNNVVSQKIDYAEACPGLPDTDYSG